MLRVIAPKQWLSYSLAFASTCFYLVALGVSLSKGSFRLRKRFTSNKRLQG